MEIYAQRYGSGDKVLFLHGAGGNARSWYFQKEYLKAYVEVIPVDMPGHGVNADGDGLHSIEEYRDYVYEVTKKLEIDKCYVVGHSMGGAVALSFALAHQDMLKGLVLITTGAKLRIVPEILEGLKTDKEKAIRAVMDFGFAQTSPAKLKEGGVKEMMGCKTEVIYGDFDACEHFDATDSVSRIKVPTLIIAGKYDLLTPPKFSEYLHRKIEGSRFVLVEDAGHMVTLEKPKEVNEAIREFVEAKSHRPQVADQKI
jgi:pimeloyl-ACP methyl ester carboxylesterase